MGEAGGRGQERWVGRNPGCGGCGLGVSGRASGGAGELEGSGLPSLIEIVFRNGLGLGGVELGALVEVVGEGFLGDLVCFPTAGPHVEFGLRRSPGGMKERGRGRLPDVGQDLCDGLRVDQKGDELEGRPAGWTDQGEGFIDPSQEGGPSGRPGRGGVGWLGWWVFRLGRRRRGRSWERKRETGSLSGEGVILLGPGRDQRPQRSVGGEDPVVAVTVDAGGSVRFSV